MNKQSTRITTKKDFEVAWQLINRIFYVDQEMPNQVFKKPFTGFVFEEFDWAMNGEFWNTVIKQLSHISQDDNVVVAVLDPDPINYFYSNFGCYNIIQCCTSTTTGDDYWKALETGPAKSPADAMLFNSETIVWVPSSAKWALWGERSYGACVLAFADENIKQRAKPFLQTWQSAQEASDNFISLNFKDQQTPLEFANLLVQNYSN